MPDIVLIALARWFAVVRVNFRSQHRQVKASFEPPPALRDEC